MKKTLIALSFILISRSVFAEDSVTTTNGNTIVFKPQINVKGCCNDTCRKRKVKVITKVVEKPVYVEKVKVVEKKVIVEKVVEKIVTKKVKEERKKNRISILGGVGPTGLSQPSSHEVDLRYHPVGGLMYQRSLNNTLNIGIQGQTNRTVMGVVGIDF